MYTDKPITQLLVEDGRILLAVSDAESKSHPATFEAGSLQQVMQCLRHEPPAPVELESAIAQIEDTLMPILRLLPADGQLLSAAPEIAEIASAAGLREEGDVTLDTRTVERLFNQLADVAYGAPASQSGIRTGRKFVAMLLWLRELLHHAGYATITLTR